MLRGVKQARHMCKERVGSGESFEGERREVVVFARVERGVVLV